MEEKFNQLTKNFDLLYKEMQSIIFEILDNQLKIDKLDNKPHEETTSDRRPNKLDAIHYI